MLYHKGQILHHMWAYYHLWWFIPYRGPLFWLCMLQWTWEKSHASNLEPCPHWWSSKCPFLWCHCTLGTVVQISFSPAPARSSLTSGSGWLSRFLYYIHLPSFWVTRAQPAARARSYLTLAQATAKMGPKPSVLIACNMRLYAALLVVLMCDSASKKYTFWTKKVQGVQFGTV